MKRTRFPLPVWVIVGIQLRLICKCGRLRDTYTVVRVGAGRKEAWAEKDGEKSNWPRILRASDFREWGEHFEKVLS